MKKRRIYLSGAKSFCADKVDYSIMHRSKRARMDNYDEGVSSSSQNGDSKVKTRKNIAVKKRAAAKKMKTARKMTANRKAKNTNPAKMERTTTPGKR